MPRRAVQSKTHLEIHIAAPVALESELLSSLKGLIELHLGVLDLDNHYEIPKKVRDDTVKKLANGNCGDLFGRTTKSIVAYLTKTRDHWNSAAAMKRHEMTHWRLIPVLTRSINKEMIEATPLVLFEKLSKDRTTAFYDIEPSRIGRELAELMPPETPGKKKPIEKKPIEETKEPEYSELLKMEIAKMMLTHKPHEEVYPTHPPGTVLLPAGGLERCHCSPDCPKQLMMPAMRPATQEEIIRFGLAKP